MHNSGGVYSSIVLVEKPLPGQPLRPLLPQVLHESAQGLHNVVSIDLHPPGDDVGVDKVPAIEEGLQHLLGAASLDSPGGLPFSIHCLDCILVSGVW